MRAIERYEKRVSWLRDGVWSTFVVLAILGQVGLANALLFGGLSWFALALLMKLPRVFIALRQSFGSRWRLVNRLILMNVAVFTLAREYADHVSPHPGVAIVAMVAVVTTLAIVTLTIWAYSLRPD